MLALFAGSAATAALALASAASWGGGDFAGGMGVKAAGGTTLGALRVVMLAHVASLAVLVLVCLLTHAPVPHGAPLVWGLVAGATAAISLTAFYIALSRGTMGPSAAVSGLLAAAIPAAVSSYIEGRPGVLHIAGFVLAAVAIWAIAAGEAHDTPGTMTLALVGGVGFGIYFVALRMANPLGVFEPMALARSASLVTCGLLFVFFRLRALPEGKGASLSQAAMMGALGVAVLDTGGNLLFIAATRAGRLDVAAVLASLYPAGTILLAAWRLHEKPARRQLAGMAVALVAVVLVSL